MNDEHKKALKLWERELILAKCMKDYEITDNLIDYNRIENFDDDNTDEICDQCLTEFCFRELNWKNELGSTGDIKDKLLNCEYQQEMMYV